ncbi:immunity protein Imm33 domain-containing protein [Pseudoalteromonas carrageenovora]|uniref:immunity protein Imm33 domain-containing protein n=1 Tax=Pseudoalteromonas carrageenovora TaxID=227 RepID=UPI0026E1F26A|nr:hypothetical protein [Pseudoalteromonas carrageenovora]MDO6547631.1 hypothetical protein [Pseudoalteromonas carrageenovora]MDO6832092.1 hypothetical protein [Pseudoalteromonas carrageenovora]|tara:strand:+ start:939 stop:1295 length:357 start_codon:yes stop_codon:yes gene_type:complete
MSNFEELLDVQQKCCEHYGAESDVPKFEQMVAISEGVYEGNLPIEGVRYKAPEHMTGWYLTTDLYDGDVSNLKTVHFQHIAEKRPEIAIYMSLPAGYRFLLGGEEEHVWFDEKVATEN